MGMAVSVCVVVPLRTDDPDRLAASRWVRDWYRRHFPSWRWVEADCTGAWNKPRALNETIAGLDCDQLVVTDADLYIAPGRLATAVAVGPWCVPHGRVYRLTRDATLEVYAGSHPAGLPTLMNPYRSVAGGGLFTISRRAWDDVGGMDPTFTGWGCEDQAFAVAADTIVGEHVRLPGPLWHLYHPPGRRKQDPTFRANRARLRRYRRAAGDPARIRRLTDGRDRR